MINIRGGGSVIRTADGASGSGAASAGTDVTVAIVQSRSPGSDDHTTDPSVDLTPRTWKRTCTSALRDDPGYGLSTSSRQITCALVISKWRSSDGFANQSPARMIHDVPSP